MPSQLGRSSTLSDAPTQAPASTVAVAAPCGRCGHRRGHLAGVDPERPAGPGRAAPPHHPTHTESVIAATDLTPHQAFSIHAIAALTRVNNAYLKAAEESHAAVSQLKAHADALGLDDSGLAVGDPSAEAEPDANG